MSRPERFRDPASPCRLEFLALACGRGGEVAVFVGLDWLRRRRAVQTAIDVILPWCSPIRRRFEPGFGGWFCGEGRQKGTHYTMGSRGTYPGVVAQVPDAVETQLPAR